MNKTGIIYMATDTARNNLQYIGQTIGTLNKRKSGNYNPYFRNAMNHHGDKIVWEIVGKFLAEDLDLIECCYIYCLDTIFPNGYNFESGGSKNKKHSEAIKKKISEAHIGMKPNTETKKKLSKVKAGEKTPMYGRHHSKETKIKMSKASKGVQAGEKHYGAKLTWAKIKEIRKKYITGKYTQISLAKEYKISKTQIGYIVNNKRWIQ